MTVPRVKPGNWASGEKLTSSQMNSVDTNITYVLDKRSGQTDTLQSEVVASGAGRIVDSHASGANAATTYYATGGNTSLKIPSSLSADRVYTFSNTGASAGDRIHIYSAATLDRVVTINDDGGTTLCKLGSSPYLDDDFDARGCVLRHDGTDWFLESLSYERYEVQGQASIMGVSSLRAADNSIGAANAQSCCWDVKNRRFWFCGGVDIVGYSEKGGDGIEDDVIPGGVKATVGMWDIAASDAGVVVATCADTSVYRAASGGAFARYAVMPASSTGVAVTFDVVNNRFVAAALTASATSLRSSADGVTWNTYGAAPNPVTVNFTGVAIGTNGEGRVVAAFFDTSGEIHFNYSDDGGLTWTTAGTVTGLLTGFDPTYISPKIAYNPQRGQWAVCIGIGGTCVVTSDDGITWALSYINSSGTDPEVRSLVAIGGHWFGVGRDHDLVMSRDRFNSIQYLGKKLNVVSAYSRPSIAAGGGLVFAFSEGTTFSGSVPGNGFQNIV